MTGPPATSTTFTGRFLPAEFSRETETLKLVAVGAMLCDHVNQIVLHGRYVALTTMGRLAFPLFAYVLAYNFVFRSRRPWRFVARLFGWAVVSQLFYMYAFASFRSNVLFTLAFGLIYARVFQAGERQALGWAFTGALWFLSRFLAPILPTLEFGVEGVLLVYAWAQLLQFPTAWRWGVVILFTASLNATSSAAETALYGLGALGSLLLITRLAYRRTVPAWEKQHRWLFYLFYPAHLFLLRFMVG